MVTITINGKKWQPILFKAHDFVILNEVKNPEGLVNSIKKEISS